MPSRIQPHLSTSWTTSDDLGDVAPSSTSSRRGSSLPASSHPTSCESSLLDTSSSSSSSSTSSTAPSLVDWPLSRDFVWRLNGGRRSSLRPEMAAAEHPVADERPGTDSAGTDHRPPSTASKADRPLRGSSVAGGCRGCWERQQAENSYADVQMLRADGIPAAAEFPSQAVWPTTSASAMTEGESSPQGAVPERLHDLKHDSSVLAIAVSDEYLFAGTHDGEILVWSLDSFQLVTRIQAHKRSVLCLFLSPPPSDPSSLDSSTQSTSSSPPTTTTLGRLLVSSAGDATISIWSPTTFQRLYEIYSTYDVGDIFSVAFSVQHQTVYIGAQDTSIQWVKIDDPRRRVAADDNHPDRRHHRFFDSKAVGGTSTPRRSDERWSLIPKAQTVLEVHPSAIRQFAHFGYVYCMLMARGPAHNLEANEEVLISGGGDGTVKLWKIGRGGEAGGGGVYNDDGDSDSESSLSSLGSRSSDPADSEETGGTIRPVMTLGHDDGMSVLSLAIDGSFLYCGKLDGVVELWDLDTRQRLRVIKAHNSDVMALQMNWGYLWSASANGFAAKHSTVHYGGEGERPQQGATVSQKYQCLNRWKAHDGKILASATTTFKKARLYITGANDAVVSIWRVTDAFASAEAQAEEAEDAMVKSLRDFVSYKTVSSRPEFAEDCHRGATFLCTLFKRLGGEVQMLQTRDKAHNPVVLAKFAGKGGEQADKKTRVLFYGHYDVVAADTKKGKWTSDPFALKGENGYLYGRGVSDNKGPIMAALYAVADLLQAKSLASDVLFLIEGEEEAGSRGFQETVREHQERSIGHVDYILLANSYWIDDETPCLTYGLRGVLHATVSVDSAHPDLHSGVDGSYMMAEPLSDLTMVLSTLKGPRNRVMIPRFYDAVLPMRADEEARFDAISRMLVQRCPENGPAALLKASLKSRWREPNLTIHRYKVSGPDGSLVSSHACANISIRLVPGQEVDDIVASLKAFLRAGFARLESTNRLSVQIDNKAEPWLGDPDNYIFRTLDEAVVAAWGMGEEASPAKDEKTDENNPTAHRPAHPLYIREGGSIPAIRFLEKQFGAPAAHLPCGQASDAAHLDNERLRVENLQKSREIFRQVFQTL